MSGRPLALHCWRLHQAAERGDRAAGARLHRLSKTGFRAGQCYIDLVMGWHRHAPGAGGCHDGMGEQCPEASDGAVWAASWELYWPPGCPPVT